MDRLIFQLEVRISSLEDLLEEQQESDVDDFQAVFPKLYPKMNALLVDKIKAEALSIKLDFSDEEEMLKRLSSKRDTSWMLKALKNIAEEADHDQLFLKNNNKL